MSHQANRDRAASARTRRILRQVFAIAETKDGIPRYRWPATRKRGSKPRKLITRRSHEAGVAEIRAAFVPADKGVALGRPDKAAEAYARLTASMPRIEAEDKVNGCKVKRRAPRRVVPS